jgi:hypothetical protein
MNITQEEFNNQFRQTLDTLIEQMADSPEVPVDKFYNMACILENLAFFSPVVYDLIRKPEE